MRVRPLLLALVLVSVQVLVIASVVQAVTITWTTTGDFDGGTYTESAGNREINSNSCNMGITAGSFELDSLKGDSFCIADTDADTFKWDLFTVGVAGGTPIRRILAGTLDLQVSGASAYGVGSSVTITGDWDFRVKLDITTASGQFEFWVFNTDLTTRCSGTQDGTGIIVTAVDIFHFRCINGVFSLLGSFGSLPSDPIWLRLTRSTNTFTTYYSTVGPSDTAVWTQFLQDTQVDIVNPMFITIYVGQGTNGAASWDDYFMNAGTIASGGFRTSGSWTSATQIYTREVPYEIAITYSGASAANYIDAVRIVDSAGATIFTDDTDRTSGSSAVSTVPFSVGLQQNWAVRILLAGGGAGTPTLEAVSVETAAPPSGEDRPPTGFPGFGIDCVPQIHLIRCILTLPQTAGLGILETQWYVDGSYQGLGRALDPARQEIELRSPWALMIYRGQANVTVLVLLSNGQELRQSEILDVDNSWVAFFVIIGSVAAVSLGLLRWAGKLELRRKRKQDREQKGEANWRWKLFE